VISDNASKNALSGKRVKNKNACREIKIRQLKYTHSHLLFVGEAVFLRCKTSEEFVNCFPENESEINRQEKERCEFQSESWSTEEFAHEERIKSIAEPFKGIKTFTLFIVCKTLVVPLQIEH
jgi:hypothetical protein